MTSNTEAAKAVTIPPAGENKTLDEFLHDVFTTALEGGITYWIHELKTYVWAGDDGKADRAGFVAVIRYENPNDEGWMTSTIDRATLVKAFEAMAAGPVEGMPERQRYKMLAGLFGALVDTPYFDCDFDAGDADDVVQVGVLGTVVFG